MNAKNVELGQLARVATCITRASCLRRLSRTAIQMCGALIALGALSSALAENPEPARDLAQKLVSQYHLTIRDIVSSLTYFGVSMDPTIEPHLVRWEQPALTITVLLSGNAEAVAQEFVGHMNGIEALVGGHATYCVQKIDVTEFGNYSPALKDLQCWKRHHDAIIVIDASPSPPTALFRDLGTISPTALERSRWTKRGLLDAEHLRNAGCSVGVDVDQTHDAVLYASAYLPIAADAEDALSTKRCLLALPFLLLSQKPIEGPDSQSLLFPELLQLLYSAELRNGMTRTEILKKIQ